MQVFVWTLLLQTNEWEIVKKEQKVCRFCANPAVRNRKSVRCSKLNCAYSTWQGKLSAEEQMSLLSRKSTATQNAEKCQRGPLEQFLFDFGSSSCKNYSCALNIRDGIIFYSEAGRNHSRVEYSISVFCALRISEFMAIWQRKPDTGFTRPWYGVTVSFMNTQN